MVYLQRFDAWPNAPDSFRVAGAVALLRVLSPMPPDDGQVQHAAALGHEQGQQPVGEVVEVGGFLEHGFDGRAAHHDQAVHVAGAVRVLPTAVGQTPHRDVLAVFVGQCFVGVGHHGLRAGIQRIGQLCEGTGFVQIVGIDEGHQRQRALCIACRACLADTARNAGQNVQLDRCVLEAGDAGLPPFGRLVQGEQMNIDARLHHTPPQYCPQRRP
jgi:hypothetical protein